MIFLLNTRKLVKGYPFIITILSQFFCEAVLDSLFKMMEKGGQELLRRY